MCVSTVCNFATFLLPVTWPLKFHCLFSESKVDKNKKWLSNDKIRILSMSHAISWNCNRGSYYFRKSLTRNYIKNTYCYFNLLTSGVACCMCKIATRHILGDGTEKCQVSYRIVLLFQVYLIQSIWLKSLLAILELLTRSSEKCTYINHLGTVSGVSGPPMFFHRPIDLS